MIFYSTHFCPMLVEAIEGKEKQEKAERKKKGEIQPVTKELLSQMDFP